MCYQQWMELQAAEEGTPEYDAALGRYLACMEGIYEARAAHSAAETEEQYLRWQSLEAAREALFGRVKPWPRPCGPRSLGVRAEIFADTAKAMAISEGLEQIFTKAGVQLKEDESFACLVCVVKKPEFVSEALAVDPLGVKAATGARLNYILSPAVMKPMLNAVDQDRIKG